MDTTTKKSMHPLVATAAVSVTLFSLVGIAAITGLIPTSHSQFAPIESAKPAEEPSPLARVPAPAQSAAAVATTPATAAKPIEKHAAHKTAMPAEKAVKPAAAPANSNKESAPVTVAQNDQAPAPAMIPPPPPPAIETPRPQCYDCGVIESVRQIEKKGEGSGVGAVAGGLLGGVLGHQTGAGRGKDAMTVLGAIGGAVAGHQIEKNAKKAFNYQIVIRFEDGTSRVITQDTPPIWRSGDKVRLVNGVINPNSNSL